MNHSDYVVYVDESGDHGLQSIDPHYPVFVLAFCIFHKRDYIDQVTPALQDFKFRHFGHDQVILHETDIRRDRGDFSFLNSPERKSKFLGELTCIMEQANFTLVCSVIRKEAYRERYSEPDNPYHVALGYGLERVFYFLRQKGAGNKKTHIIVEKRGRTEDDELELAFRRICDGENFEKRDLPFELIFSDKKSNSTGLQFADLVARPVGLHLLRPNQENRAFEVLEKKFYGGASRNGRGLTSFP